MAKTKWEGGKWPKRSLGHFPLALLKILGVFVKCVFKHPWPEIQESTSLMFMVLFLLDFSLFWLFKMISKNFRLALSFQCHSLMIITWKFQLSRIEKHPWTKLPENHFLSIWSGFVAHLNDIVVDLGKKSDFCFLLDATHFRNFLEKKTREKKLAPKKKKPLGVCVVFFLFFLGTFWTSDAR